MKLGFRKEVFADFIKFIEYQSIRRLRICLYSGIMQVLRETGGKPVRARRREVHEYVVLTRSHIRGHVIGEI